MWRINVVLELALLLVLFGRRAHLRWPALAAFLTTICVRDAICVYADWCSNALLYRDAYYIGSTLAIVAEVFLIREISLKLVGPIQCLRAIVGRNVPAMTATFILAATFSRLLWDHPWGVPHLATVIYYARRLDLAASVGCSGGLIMLIGIAVSLKVQFSHGVRPIAVGLLIETAFSYIQAVMTVDDWVADSIFPSVRCAAYLTSLICFSAPALTTRRDRSLPTSPNTALPRLIKGVRAHV